MVLSVNEQTFNQEVLESPIPVLVHFWAPWCGLCRNIQPLLLQFQSQYSHQVKVVNINADENFKLANSFRLKTLPTLILIENGSPKQRWESLRGREELRRELEKIQLFYSDKLYSLAGANLLSTVDWEQLSSA